MDARQVVNQFNSVTSGGFYSFTVVQSERMGVDCKQELTMLGFEVNEHSGICEVRQICKVAFKKAWRMHFFETLSEVLNQ
jgi:hypothetical protein